ncbi:MAG: hypothetical protein ACKOUT_14545 [Novosphingobium sp.]
MKQGTRTREAGLLLALFAVLVALRLPGVWQGRFFGEEGTNFFAYAWHEGAWRGLWNPLGGYLNIIASGAASLSAALVQSGILPLEHAPFVTTGIAFLIQLLPAVVLVTARDGWLAAKWVRPVALLVIAVSPFTEEVWLNSIHGQFHMALACALLLALSAPAQGWARTWRCAVLFIAPLAGPGAIVLAPFYALRAAIERDRARAVQALALLAGATIQLGLFFTRSGVRGQGPGIDELAAVLVVRNLLQPFASPGAAQMAAGWLRGLLEQPGLSLAVIAMAALAFAPLAVAVLRRWRTPLAWLVVPGLALATVSYWGGISTGFELLKPNSAMRYVFVPQVLLCLGMVWLASAGQGMASRVARVLVGLNLLIGVLFFTVDAAGLGSGPSWSAEAAQWRRDPHHALAIWPEGWRMDLSPEKRSCGSAPEPSWCNGAWEAMERDAVRAMDRPAAN